MAWERGDDALRHFEKAIAIQPRDLPAHMAMGLELLCRGEWERASAAYRTASEIAETDEQRSAADEGFTLATNETMPTATDPRQDIWEELLAAG
jgi:tetratricopeptide (TPR) repeat protein